MLHQSMLRQIKYAYQIMLRQLKYTILYWRLIQFPNKTHKNIKSLYVFILNLFKPFIFILYNSCCNVTKIATVKREAFDFYCIFLLRFLF